MKVVAFNGSPRQDGNTVCLINHVFEALRNEGIETEFVQLGGNLVHGCTACYECFKRKNYRCVLEEDIINDCIEQMRRADGIILASPTYFADVTSEMKALMDRGGFVARANGNFLRRKVGAAIAVARKHGAIHAFDTMNHFFLIGEMLVPGSNYWNLALGREKGEVENDQEAVRTMKILGENMAWLLKKVR
jgi:multimeric flavodoxin WrbA